MLGFWLVCGPLRLEDGLAEIRAGSDAAFYRMQRHQNKNDEEHHAMGIGFGFGLSPLQQAGRSKKIRRLKIYYFFDKAGSSKSG